MTTGDHAVGPYAVARRDRQMGGVGAECPETVNEWFGRWSEARKAKGIRTTHNDLGRFNKWLAPHIGTRPMVAVTRREIEELVQHLDLSVQRAELSWKTAQNVWGVLTKMFSDATRSKVLSLRVREDNPAREVQGPDRGAERDGPYVYPREFEAMLACKRVPARWKRIFTLATYLYVRGGELEALEWSAVNFDLRYVHVHQAVHAHSGDIKPTKTKANRRVPIEPTLLPLLETMYEEANGEGRVVTAMPPREEWAERLRKYVRWGLEDAGLHVREELFAADETRRQLSFHDLRHTGITWRAVRGDEPLKIQRAAGHDDLRTTQRYIEEAEAFDRAGFGEPFPALDLGSLSPFANSDRPFGILATLAAQSSLKQGDSWRPQRDSNPR